MAYIQKNNPFPITSCGRRRAFMNDNVSQVLNLPGKDRTEESPFPKLRKTTRGKGRHFLSAKEGAGMTAAGRAAYNKETGGNLKAPQPGGGKRKKSFCARSLGQIKKFKIDCKKTPEKRACAARRRWKC